MKIIFSNTKKIYKNYFIVYKKILNCKFKEIFNWKKLKYLFIK